MAFAKVLSLLMSTHAQSLSGNSSSLPLSTVVWQLPRLQLSDERLQGSKPVESRLPAGSHDTNRCIRTSESTAHVPCMT